MHSFIMWLFFVFGLIALPVTAMRAANWGYHIKSQSAEARNRKNPIIRLLTFVSSSELVLGCLAVTWILAPFVNSEFVDVLRLIAFFGILCWLARNVGARIRKTMSAKTVTASTTNDFSEDTILQQQSALDYVRRKPGAVLVIGVLNRNQRNVYVYRNGTAMSHVPPGEIVFEIGSITKVFTSALLADMVSCGEMQLEGAIWPYLGDCLDEDRPASSITLLQLSTHTSGLPRLAPKTLLNAWLCGGVNPYREFSREDLCRFLKNYPGRREESATIKSRYSNLGMDLLGCVLANRLGQSYGEAIHQRLSMPLGLTDTTLTLRDDQTSRLAVGHLKNGTIASNWDFQLGGAGGLHSTVDDLLTFASAYMGHTDTGLEDLFRFCHEQRVDVVEGLTSAIGLNWLIHPSGVIWHNGGTGGYSSFLGFSEEHEAAVVVLSNYAEPVDSIGFETLNHLMSYNGN